MDDRKQNNSRVAAIMSTRNEISENQARWILMPLFGLGILFYAAGVILG
jgi:hypothetical protein